MINYWRGDQLASCYIVDKREATNAAALRYLMKDGRVPFLQARLPSTRSLSDSERLELYMAEQSVNQSLKVDQRRPQSHTSVT
jgi:hypothetical protein